MILTSIYISKCWSSGYPRALYASLMHASMYEVKLLLDLSFWHQLIWSIQIELPGRAKLSSVWIHHVHRSHCSKGVKDSFARNSSVFWGVIPFSLFLWIRYFVLIVLYSYTSFILHIGSQRFFLLISCREKLNSMNLLLYMAPIAVILLLPATIFMEDNVVGVTIQLAKKDFTIVWLLLFNSCLAYFVNLTNFLVTKHTSALTLQVRNVLLLINSSFLQKLIQLGFSCMRDVVWIWLFLAESFRV